MCFVKSILLQLWESNGKLSGKGTGNRALGGEGTRKVRWETRVSQNDLICSTVATQVFILLVYSIV